MNRFVMLSWVVLLAAFPNAAECRTEPGGHVSKVAGTLATLPPGTSINVTPANTAAPTATSAPESRLSIVSTNVMHAASPYPGTRVYIAACGTGETLTGGSCSCPGSSNIAFAGPGVLTGDRNSWQCICSTTPACPAGVPAGECVNNAYAVCAHN